MVLLLIRYNELGLKSPRVRSRFQKQMIRNIEDKFLKADLDCFIDSDWGRIYLHTDDQPQGLRILSTVFGITSVSPVTTSSDKIEDITETVLKHAKTLLKPRQSFAIRTRRTGKHVYTSQDLAHHLGSAVLDKYEDLNLTVNLRSPDVELFVEVRNKQSYIFSESVPGPGGLPLGTQGKLVSIFTHENSFIATWLMMKRGCRTYPLYIKPIDKESTISESQVRDQVEILKNWVPNIDLKIIELEDRNNNNFDNAMFDNKEFIDYARKTRVKGIVLSEDFDSFVSSVTKQKSEFPVFYPLIGLAKEQIQDLARRISAV